MKYSCSMCGKQYHPCVIDVKGIVPEAPYSCPYANDRTEVKADWKEMKEQDFEMNCVCADCSNCEDNCDNCKNVSGFSIDVARALHGLPSMQESLKSEFDAGNARFKKGKSEQHDAPLMSDNLSSAIDAANKIAAIKNGSTKDPKSRYYGVGGVETLDIIKAKLTPEQYRGFLLGNIIKYSCRANHKGEFDRDIEKVRFYGAAIFGTLTGWNKYGGTCK